MTVGFPTRRVFYNPFTWTQFQLYRRCISNVWFNLQSSKYKEHGFDGVPTNEWFVLYTHTTNIMGATCIIHLYTSSYTISLILKLVHQRENILFYIYPNFCIFDYLEFSQGLSGYSFWGQSQSISRAGQWSYGTYSKWGAWSRSRNLLGKAGERTTEI